MATDGPVTYDGPLADLESSGSSVTLDLGATLTSDDLLLLFVVFEPFALASTFLLSGNLQNQFVRANARLPWGDFDDSASTEVGFAEWRSMGNARSTATGGTDASGLPIFTGTDIAAAFDRPDGIGAKAFALRSLLDYSEVVVEFEQRTTVSEGAYSVPWCYLAAWRFGGFDEWIAGNTTSQSKAEGAILSFHDLGVHAAAQGDTYAHLFGEATSDGGDVEHHFGPVFAWPVHDLEIGIAGRWGQGSGSWTWHPDAWGGGTPPPVLLDTVDRSQTHADARYELYYKLLPSPAQPLFLPVGTFGAQSNDQDVDHVPYEFPEEPPPGGSWDTWPFAFYRGVAYESGVRGVPSGGNAMARTARIFTVAKRYPAAGLTQIYRRVVGG